MLDPQLLRNDLAGAARRLADRGGQPLDTAAFERLEGRRKAPLISRRRTTSTSVPA